MLCRGHDPRAAVGERWRTHCPGKWRPEGLGHVEETPGNDDVVVTAEDGGNDHDTDPGPWVNKGDSLLITHSSDLSSYCHDIIVR